jgi:hypothetical protein
MITSMWSDEEDLSRWKRILRYSLIWMLFINMPWTIYNAIKWDRANVSWWVWWGSWWGDPSSLQNLFINTEFATTINNTVIKFLKIWLVWIAVIVIIWSWISIIISRWKEDKLSEAKNKILWSIIWLIFVWFIEIWQRFVYTWDIKDAWTDIFKTIANLALFLAAPTAIFFLCLAWYYYITAGWDQEKTKKWKSIIVNVVIATVILLVSYIFLIDLRDL